MSQTLDAFATEVYATFSLLFEKYGQLHAITYIADYDKATLTKVANIAHRTSSSEINETLLNIQRADIGDAFKGFNQTYLIIRTNCAHQKHVDITKLTELYDLDYLMGIYKVAQVYGPNPVDQYIVDAIEAKKMVDKVVDKPTNDKPTNIDTHPVNKSILTVKKLNNLALCPVLMSFDPPKYIIYNGSYTHASINELNIEVTIPPGYYGKLKAFPTLVGTHNKICDAVIYDTQRLTYMTMSGAKCDVGYGEPLAILSIHKEELYCGKFSVRPEIIPYQ